MELSFFKRNCEMKEIRFKKLDDKAIIPKYQTYGSAGFDLHSIISVNIPSDCQFLIPTGLSCEIPLGTELQLRPRSGLALKHMLSVTNSPGTLDSDYRGPIGIILINHGSETYHVSEGDRIAQAVLCPVFKVKIVEVEKLSETDRGGSGYGSTGN
jgi:dUTP pyrophosphatase